MITKGREAIVHKNIFVLFILFLLLSACHDDDDNEVVGNGNQTTSSSVISAVIIAPEIAKLKTDITVSAAGSSSTGTNPLAYDWKIISEPEASSGVIKTASSRAAKLYATVEGVYKIKLTVSDGTASSTTEREIKVDLDGDGALSANDDDMDGDGILNANDAFPQNVTEWVDSDKNGIGNYTQSDEDGDGIKDEVDDYPFDVAKSVISVFQESEFNGNLYPDGNRIGGTYPFKVSGVINSGFTYQVDVDYYLFNATAGELISIVLRSNNNFTPSIALLDSVGSSLTTVKTNTLGDEGIYVISARIPESGEYALSVTDIDNKVSPEYTYTLDVFKDSDMDGLSDEKELAMGMINTNPDSDGDNISDGFEYYMAKNNFDADSDGLPVWWDTDSENDGADDLMETVADVDGDNISNFLDLDSDGNSINDIVELGADPLAPIDTDGDNILDFVDLDDDSDGLLDVNDNNKATKVTKAELSDKENRLVVFSSATNLVVFGKQIRNIARIGDVVTLVGEGFGTKPLVLWEHKGGVANIMPTTSSTTELTFIVPQGVATGRVKVFNGAKVSEPLELGIVSQNNPFIFSVTSERGKNYVMPNETLTIKGANFKGTSINAAFGGVVQPATIINDTTLKVVVPENAVSGDFVIVGSETSNPVALEVRQSTNGMVKLPTSSALAFKDITVEFTGSSTSTVAANGSFTLATRNEGATSISIFAPKKANHPPAIFLSATVLPGQTHVEMSPSSTAVDLVYSAMGLEASIAQDDQSKVLDILKTSVSDFSNFLDQKLGANAYYLEDYQKDEFVTNYLAAIKVAGKALETAVTNGTIHRASNNVASKQLGRVVRKSTGNTKVLPKENQQDYIVTLETSGDAYSGVVNIENDTMLFADAKVTNAYNGAIVRDYVNGYFSSDLLGPQRGIFSGYWATDTEVDLKYRSVNVVVYTPGLQGMKSWSEYYNSPSYKLAIRTFLSQALVPVINAAVGVKFSDSTTNKVLNILFTYGVFDGLEAFWTTPSASGFANGIGKIVQRIVDPRQLLLEKVVQAVAEDLAEEELKKLAIKLGIKLTPWGSAATVVSVGSTVVDLGKLATDVGSTKGQIFYKVIFPISVESVEPNVLMRDDESKEIKLYGDGLGPITRGSIFGGSVHYPTVEFKDKNGKSYTDTKPRYETYLIAQGSTPPRSPLKVTLPASYLKNAESPLSVILHHHLVDEDVFSDDLVKVDLDTQLVITLVDKLTISSINPAKGAWGDNVKITGAGFSGVITDNTVYFTKLNGGGTLAATITNATATELSVIVPKGAGTGNVWATVQRSGKTQESNKLSFTLEQQNYLFTFGDNGSANDDTFALYIDGQHLRTMPAPSRIESAELSLTPGRHTVKLHGITAPDAVGTYYISFPQGVSLVSGDSISGSDLTAGQVKSWIIDVQMISNKTIKRRVISKPRIIWKE